MKNNNGDPSLWMILFFLFVVIVVVVVGVTICYYRQYQQPIPYHNPYQFQGGYQTR